ncbi:MAG TPA: hypothetical protein VFO10_11765 [Oligoflexus sp.]|nr:hypothetical protein [Oligoflexus sp.]HET9237924.1 hypothetical protein [Oligoflexus sp.]
MVRAQSMVDNAPINTTMADRGWQRRRGFAELATRLNQIVTTVAVEGL